MNNEALLAKLLSKRRVTETGCWEWTGWCRRNGYGEMYWQGKSRPVHRVVWIDTHGPVPEGMDVMHKCDNAPCFNPAHLELGTRQQNLKQCVANGRHFFAKKTHCNRGHEFTAENTIVLKEGWRRCKICDRARFRIYHGWPADLAYSAPAGYTGFVPPGLVRGPKPLTKPQKNRTHCPQGHELTGDNLYISKQGYRKCRPCKTASTMRFQRQIPVGFSSKPGAEQ